MGWEGGRWDEEGMRGMGVLKWGVLGWNLNGMVGWVVSGDGFHDQGEW